MADFEDEQTPADEQTPVGGRRGYTRTMTAIMVIIAAVIVLVGIIQWIRV